MTCIVFFQDLLTPLYTASIHGHLQTVRLLLQRGAEVDSVNEVRDL